MSGYSAAVLEKAGIDAENHGSRPYTGRLKKTVDFFICMTRGHKQILAGSEHPHVYAFSDITDSGDVSDPFMGDLSDYQKMFDHILYAVPDILNFIERGAVKKLDKNL
jgi:protein-tyrosine-phosphatase